MSSFLPVNSDQFLRAVDPLDESWLLLLAGEIRNEGEVSNYVDQESQLVVENGLESMNIVGSPNPRKININRKMINEPSVAKKQDHNAKERIRRMKINASFLALRALLPDSTRSKKRWGAPALVDRVVKYIPEMEKEVEALKSKKESLQSKANNKDEEGIPTFSFNKVNQEEAVIQVCMPKKEYEEGLGFMKIMQKVEDEGISINSVSALCICDSIICCHFHIQISDATFGVDYTEQLRDKIISWLR